MGQQQDSSSDPLPSTDQESSEMQRDDYADDYRAATVVFPKRRKRNNDKRE